MIICKERSNGGLVIQLSIADLDARPVRADRLHPRHSTTRSIGAKMGQTVSHPMPIYAHLCVSASMQ